MRRIYSVHARGGRTRAEISYSNYPARKAPFEKKAEYTKGYNLRQLGHLAWLIKTRCFPSPSCEGFGVIGN